MKKYFTFSVTAIIALFFFASCDKEKEGKDCISYDTAEVRSVTGANSVPVNQETDLTVSYFIGGMGKLASFETNSTGTTTLISLKAKYECCACSDNLILGQN